MMETTTLVIGNLKKIGIDAINKESRNITESVMESLGDLYIVKETVNNR